MISHWNNPKADSNLPPDALTSGAGQKRAGMGLRERNRRLKQKALVSAANALFEEQGFDETQMEQIAARAGTSTATAYNYFDSKNKLLSVITLQHLRNALPARRALLANLPDDPVEGIIAFERLLARQTLQTLGKKAWRAIYRAGYDVPPTSLTRLGGTLTWIISLHYRRMFGTYQARGRLSPELDMELATELVTIAGTAYFARFLMKDEMTVDELVSFIPPYAGVILSPWLLCDAAPVRPSFDRAPDPPGL